MKSESAWIDIIEASYDIGRTEADWIRGVLTAASPLLNHGLGIWAFSYDLEGTHRVHVRSPVALHLPGDATIETVLAAQSNVSQESIAQTFQTTTCGTASQLLGRGFAKKAALEAFRERGVADSIGINVRDPRTTGCVFVGILPQPMALSPAVIALWKRMTSHIAAGFRLQRAHSSAPRNGADSAPHADVIVSPRGKIEHAEPAAQSEESRAKLRDAVRAIEASRTRRGRVSAEYVVDQRTGLVAARWSMVERLEVDGRRYFLARENAPIRESPLNLNEP